jgi:hypothetical protein
MAKHQAEDSKAHSVTTSGLPKFVKIGILVLVLLTFLVIGVFGYRFYTLQQKTKGQAQLSSEPKELVSQVGKLMDLPLNEQPTIATVSDVTKLKDQPFFALAQNGDKVLIYQKAKKAILYRPATGKIIDVGPVNIQPTPVASASAATTKTSPTPASGPAVDISIYNGTKRSGLTKSAETQVEAAYKSATVKDRTNAKNDYKETIVVDITGKNKAAAATIAKIVSGKVVTFPKGEASTSADILIILGDNYQAQ